ncbi:MAG TPA: CARDB domain-containing protein [Candidatus Thermoplasmatota archaeon]|nr:CARDB domain-containing protein [Candidatus Thermoplasmatota archaeon]
MREDGSFPASDHTMLVTPELDLRSGMPNQGNTLDAVDEEVNGALTDLWAALNGPAMQVLKILADHPVPFLPWPTSLGTPPRAPGGDAVETYRADRFSFDLRTNLRPGLDGLQAWAFTQRPERLDAMCAGDCRVLQPDVAYDSTVPGLEGGAYTGAHGWRRVSLDLSAYVGRSVWIGFVLVTRACPQCATSTAFDPSMGFQGVDLDAFEARILAPLHSVRLRPLAEPSFIPPGQTMVTLPPGVPTRMVAEVANLGRSPETFDITLSLVRDGVTSDLPSQRLALPAGATAVVTGDVAAQAEGDAVLRAQMSAIDGDQDPADNAASQPVRFADVHAAGASELVASTLSARVGDPPVTFTTTLVNVGNHHVDVVLTPSLQDLTDNVTLGRPLSDATSLLDNATVRTVGLDLGETRQVSWTLATTRPGQFGFRVDVVSPDQSQDLRHPGVGIGRQPPPLLYQDSLMGEPRGTFVETWSSSGAVPGQDWTKGSEYSLDPRVVYFMGRNGTCSSIVHLDGCKPFATLRDPAAGNLDVPSSRPASADLFTPAVFVPENAPDPRLRFDHQFATSVYIKDCDLSLSSSCFEPGIHIFGSIFLWGQLGDKGADGEIAWGPEVMLQGELPIMRGAAAEQAMGILDSERGPRAYRDHALYCSGSQPCQWWWPSGTDIAFQAKGSPYPGRANFTGSPWIQESIPLVSDTQGTGGGTPFDARGHYFRARFQYPQAGRVRNALEPTSEGWRIGTFAVTPTGTSELDLAATAVRVETLYDVSAVGLGPGQDVPVRVTIANRGLQRVPQGTVKVTATDGQQVYGLGSATFTSLDPDVIRNLTVSLHLTAPEGARLRIMAEVAAPAGADDFPGDNRIWDRAVYPVHASMDIAAVAQVLPRAGSLEAIRNTPLAIENRGNVPVVDPEIHRVVERSAAAAGRVTVLRNDWKVVGTLQPGHRMDLADPNLDVRDASGAKVSPFFALFFSPTKPGDYTEFVRVSLGTGLSDADPANDVALVPFSVRTMLYRDPFDDPAQANPVAVSGEPSTLGTAGVWAPTDGGIRGSRGRLLAGDAATGEIVPGTDASYVLPPLDLTGVKDATLSFQQRYSLEDGFDAARVELGVWTPDSGLTWEPLRPRPDALHGLPQGYPAHPLLADSPFVQDKVAPVAVAYTGASASLPGVASTGADAGWVGVEYNLGDAAALRRNLTVESFLLTGLATSPSVKQASSIAVRSGPSDELGKPAWQWTDPTWALAEPNAVGNERYWWVENATFRLPARDGETVWWSGSQGTVTGALENALNFTLAPAPGTTVLSWWDWRDGWRDGDHVQPQGSNPAFEPDLFRSYQEGERRQRDGTGGTFQVEVDGVSLTQSTQILERSDDGWTHRQAKLPAGASLLSFHYVGFMPDHANLGWFLHSPNRDGAALGMPTTTYRGGEDTNHQLRQKVRWTCIGADVPGFACARPSLSPMQRSGGWHVEADRRQVDGRLEPDWRFSDPVAPEGYPAGADARLITPVVDLGKVAGRSAALRFDHRFDFQSFPICVYPPGTGVCDSDPPPSIPRRAQDAGLVEVQVLNQTNGIFGPWAPLLAGPPSGPVSFAWGGRDLEPGVPYGVAGEHYRAIGYPSLLPTFLGSGVPRNTQDFVRTGGYAYPLEFDPAFSGSQPDWTEASFDLSSLVGQKVRFAFHAWTDSTRSTNQPRLGWELSHVAVVGEAFAGRPVQVRLRVATDGSLPKGEWSIDNLEVAGDLYGRHLGLRPDKDRMRAAPDTDVEVRGVVTNLGTELRKRLALNLVAQAGGAPLTATLAEPALPKVTQDLPPGVEDLSGPFDLGPGGSVPFRVLLHAPRQEGELTVRLRLYQDDGPTVAEPGQVPVHTVHYADPADEVPGSTVLAIHIDTRTVHKVTLAPAQTGAPALLAVDPFTGHAGEPLVFQARVANEGTVVEHVQAQWKVAERTGSGETLHEATRTVDLLPGTEVLLEEPWTPDDAGIYRTTLTLAPGSAAATLDVPVDTDLQAFTGDVASASQWAFASDAGTGETADPNAWRIADGGLLWGVRDSEFLAGSDYCNAGSTPLCTTGSNGGGTGPSATLTTPPVDLRATPGGQATLALTHFWAFAPGDGGIVEAAVFQDPVAARPACADPGGNPGEPGNPKWFRLTPEGGYPGSTRSEARSRNAIGRHPAFTGMAPGGRAITSTFELGNQDLADQAAGLGDACLATARPGGLTSGFVRVRLLAGTQPRQEGDRGWLVQAMAIGTGGITIGPHVAPDPLEGIERALPAVVDAPKRFLVDLTNRGPVGDHAVLGLGPGATALPAWFAFPTQPVSLAPGQHRLVPFDVEVAPSEEAEPQRYSAPLVAASANAPLLRDTLRSAVDLAESRLPDLSVRLRLDGQTSLAAVPVGTAVTVTALVDNQGLQESAPVHVKFLAQEAGGVIELLDDQTLGPLVAAVAGGREGSFQALSTEWIAPEHPALVTLTVIVDEAGRLAEPRRDNNQRSLQVPVVSPDAPDLAVTGLTVDGVGDDGFVEAGSFITINATVTNLGSAPAAGVQFQIVLSGVPIAEELVQTIAPGQSATVSALKAASPGEAVVKAFVFSDSATADRDPSNDATTRILRVRSHGLKLTGANITLDSAAHGQALLYVRNLGNAPDRLSGAGESRSGWQVTVAPDPILALPAVDTPLVVDVQAPRGLAAGWHNLTLTVRSDLSGTFADTVSLGILVPATAAGVEALSLAATADTRAATLTGRLANLDNTPHVVRLSVDGQPGTVVKLHPFETRPLTLQRAFTTLPPGGQRLLRLAIESDGESATHLVPVLVPVEPRLSGAWADMHVEDGPQRWLDAWLDLANTGSAAVRFTASLDGLRGSVEPATASVPAGGSATVHVRAALQDDTDATAAAGRVRVVRADDPTVSLADLELPAMPLMPDLIVSDLRIDDGNPSAGDRVAVSFVLRNAGDGPSPASMALVFRDTRLADAVEVPALAPGAQATVRAHVSMSAGRHAVIVLANGDASVSEGTVSNNGASIVFDVAASSFLRGLPAPQAGMLLVVLLALAATRRRR